VVELSSISFSRNQISDRLKNRRVCDGVFNELFEFNGNGTETAFDPQNGKQRA